MKYEITFKVQIEAKDLDQAASIADNLNVYIKREFDPSNVIWERIAPSEGPLEIG